MKRRQFLQAVSSAAILSAAGGVFLVPASAKANSKIRFGAQTNAWSIDPNNLDSFLSVLNQIKQVGYVGFETGFFNLINNFDSPQQAANGIAATGLDFIGIHIAIPFDKNDPATHLPPASLYERVANGGKQLARGDSSSAERLPRRPKM